MKASWVIGCHGLLGSALCRELSDSGAVLYRPNFRFEWNAPAVMREQLQSAVLEFAQLAQSADVWSIYWAAGTGSMQSQAASLVAETQALQWLMLQLAANNTLLARGGSVALASSAGAIYAGSADAIISERSLPMPSTAYAYAKLEQEALLADFCAAHSNIAVLAARCSTLYGPGQAMGKAQGLLTHISRRVIANQPIKIYVPLDTIRDYIEVSDAARGIVHSLAPVPAGTMLTKIIASERATTISEIIAVFQRVSRRAPKIITAAGQAGALYSRKIQFRSALAPDLIPLYRMSLVVGIARLLEAERGAFCRWWLVSAMVQGADVSIVLRGPR